MGVKRLSRDALTDHQRDRVVGAAITVFAKRGYQRTTIDNIVAAAGSSVGGFYSLFDGKEECFLLCYERIIADARSRVEEDSPAASGWADRLAAAVLTLLRAVEEDPMAARVALVEVQTAGPRALQRYEETLSSLTPALREGRELLPSGEQLPPMLEDAGIAGSAWLLHQRVVCGEAEGVTELLPEFLAILAGNYVGEAEARRLGERSLAAVRA